MDHLAIMKKSWGLTNKKMRRIVLISCSKKKLGYKAKVKDLYVSPLFKLSLKYAYLLKPDKIYILSAKHGLVDLKEELEPYEITLNSMVAGEIKDWAKMVARQLKDEVDFKNDEVVFLAGDNYRKHLLPLFSHYQVPLRGLSIGRQLHFLKKSLRKL